MTRTCNIVEPALENKKIMFFGFGYTAGFLASRLTPHGWQIAGTTTSAEKRLFLKTSGIEAWLFDRNHPLPDPDRVMKDVTHVVLSVPPDADGDPVFDMHGEDLAALEHLEWIGYLSSTSVYGDKDGRWVDETTETNPLTRQGILRLKAEQQWQSLYLREGLPLHTFRLSGIYGPGRSALDAVRSGTARRIDKPGHAFNRIHVDDIVQALIASMNKPNPGSVYNLADDEPSASHEVIQFACNMIGVASPPLLPYDQAGVAPVVQGFYKENKRVGNQKIKSELGIELIHPDYRSGLQSCLEVEEEAAALLTLPTENGV